MICNLPRAVVNTKQLLKGRFILKPKHFALKDIKYIKGSSAAKNRPGFSQQTGAMLIFARHHLPAVQGRPSDIKCFKFLTNFRQ